MIFNSWKPVLDLDYTAQATQGTYNGVFTTPALTFAQEQTSQLGSRVLTNGAGIVQTTVAGATNWGESDIYTLVDGASAAYSEKIRLDLLKSVLFASTSTVAGRGMRYRAMLQFSHSNIDTSGEIIKFGWTGPTDTNNRLHGVVLFGNNGASRIGYQQGEQGPGASLTMNTMPGGTIDVLVAEITFPFVFRLGYGAMVGSRFPRDKEINWLAGGASSWPLTGTGGVRGSGNVSCAVNNETGPPHLVFAMKAAAGSTYTVTRKRLRIEEYVE